MALGKMDHLVVSSASLSEGIAYIEDLLAVPMTEGGDHPLMGTHNALLSLGPDFYLEVIAVNPEAPAPDHARWFDLDYFTGPARLTNWAVRVPDLHEALLHAPVGTGDELSLSRGDFRWDMAVPADGRLPFTNCTPGLLSWHGKMPAPHLPDHGLRLSSLSISHPEAEALCVALGPLVADARITIVDGAPGLSAQIETPGGSVTL